MNVERARRAHEIFVQLLGARAAEREALLTSACGDDAAIASHVRRLLASAEETNDFLESPAIAVSSPEPFVVPDTVGDYLIVGVLGAGGMATVYEAIQENPKRRVALKVMHQGVTNSDRYMRFRFETEVLGRLHHPGIAQIYEAGAAPLGMSSPSPFFAMELIPDAAPITEYANRLGLSARQRIRMFLSVCDAVHHGHQVGVIHRDLKPANILVDREGRTKVIDFGVARTLGPDAESLTGTIDGRQLIGTLNYMSPEQCAVGADIDSRTDVYSLGVVLYELLCGRLPYDLKDAPLPVAINAITQEPPRRPGFIDGHEDRDLEAILLKALQKDPEQRYDGASSFAADLRRLLNHLPIEARPPGVLEQCRLFARRNRGVVTAGVFVVASVLLLAVVSTGFVFRLSNEVQSRRIAEARISDERDIARRQAYSAQIAGALAALQSGEFHQMRARLMDAPDQARGWEYGFLTSLADPSLSATLAHDNMILSFAADAEWRHYATGAANGVVHLWRPGETSPAASFRNESGALIYTLAFADQGRTLIIGDEGGGVALLRVPELRVLRTLGSLTGIVRTVVELPDGRIAAAASSGETAIWSDDSPDAIALPDDQPGGLHGIAVSPRGDLVATFNNAGSLFVRRADDLSVVQRLQYPSLIEQVAFSDDGRFIGAAGDSSRALIWSAETGELRHDLLATSGVRTLRSISFSHDGSLVAIGLVHRGIAVFSMEDGTLIRQLGGHTDGVTSVAFGRNDEILYSTSLDRTVRTWRTEDIIATGIGVVLAGHTDRLYDLAYAPDGSMLASVSRDGSLRLWDTELCGPLTRFDTDSTLFCADFSPDSRFVATGGRDGVVRVWDVVAGREVAALRGHEDWVASIEFDATGDRIVSSSHDTTARIWNWRSSESPIVLRGHVERINGVAFSPDGTLVATASRDKTVRLWDAATGEQIRNWTDHVSDVFAVLFTSDGRHLYSGSRDQTIRVWDVQSGALVATMDGHGQFVTCLALNPDETRLAAGSWFGEVVLFDVATLAQIASFRAHEAAIRGVAFSPDGRKLATASFDSTVQMYDSTNRAESRAAASKAIEAHTAAAGALAPILEGAGSDIDAALRALASAGIRIEEDSWARKALIRAFAPAEEAP